MILGIFSYLMIFSQYLDSWSSTQRRFNKYLLVSKQCMGMHEVQHIFSKPTNLKFSIVTTSVPRQRKWVTLKGIYYALGSVPSALYGLPWEILMIALKDKLYAHFYRWRNLYWINLQGFYKVVELVSGPTKTLVL